MEITGTINAILSLCGGISIIGGAIALIYKGYKQYRKPSDDNFHKIEEHEKQITELKSHVENDYRDIKEIKKMQSAMCKALVHIMDHQIYGNHTEDMKQAKSDLLNLISGS